MRDEAIELLRELVAIDSVNPSLVPGGAGEQAIAIHVESYLRALGIDVVMQETSGAAAPSPPRTGEGAGAPLRPS